MYVDKDGDMEETFRWYGPDDPVTLCDIKQVKCSLLPNWTRREA